MKKIFLGLGALALAVALVPMFAAFEAHVINVTAQIENALSVPVTPIAFGTVFPQEHLDQPLNVALSRSFFEENRVDDVEYIIRQKPKCALTNADGTQIIGPTATGHVISNGQGGYTIDCGPAPVDQTDGVWGPLPSLCEYISKDGGDEDGLETNNDDTTPSFHVPFTVASGTTTVSWLDTHGRLRKAANDTVDNWIIDLAVPCFGGYCAQDWDNFVHGINPNATSSDYIQPISNEHKVFGCDLWVEVTGVSEMRPECSDGLDNDTNGYTDHPADPGCTSPSDNDEFSD